MSVVDKLDEGKISLTRHNVQCQIMSSLAARVAAFSVACPHRPHKNSLYSKSSDWAQLSSTVDCQDHGVGYVMSTVYSDH